jgi:hypothetical protein
MDFHTPNLPFGIRILLRHRQKTYWCRGFAPEVPPGTGGPQCDLRAVTADEGVYGGLCRAFIIHVDIPDNSEVAHKFFRGRKIRHDKGKQHPPSRPGSSLHHSYQMHTESNPAAGQNVSAATLPLGKREAVVCRTNTMTILHNRVMKTRQMAVGRSQLPSQNSTHRPHLFTNFNQRIRSVSNVCQCRGAGRGQRLELTTVQLEKRRLSVWCVVLVVVNDSCIINDPNAVGWTGSQTLAAMAPVKELPASSTEVQKTHPHPCRLAPSRPRCRPRRPREGCDPPRRRRVSRCPHATARVSRRR